MRRRQPSPTYSRYFLARLRPLGRPIFWGPAIALLLLGLFTWDFWTSPNIKSALGLGSSEPEEEVAQEDKAIGADIDSTSVLLSDIGISPQKQKQKPNETVTTRPTAGGTAITTISPDRAQPAPVNPQGTFGVFNSALAERYGLTGGSVLGDAPTAVNSTGVGLTSIGNSNPVPKIPAQSALQSAMTRMSPQPSSPGINAANSTNPPVEGSAPVRGPGVNAVPDNSYTNLMGGSRPLQNYSTVPAPAPNSTLPNLSPAPIPSSFGQPSAPQPGNFGIQSPATRVNQQPFSTPRSIPGRSIGGGNIHTFSNP